MSVKIAFIMVCHKAPDHINNLIKRLLEFEDADVFLHIDRNNSGIRKSIIENSRVKILPENESFFVKWGSVEIVKATLKLIACVKRTKKDYDYIWLLSGQDYPICSAAEAEKRLALNPGMNYIDVILPGENRYDFYNKRCEIPYPSWINKNNIVVKSIKKLYMIVTGGYYHTFSFLKRKKPFDAGFAYGSQWWTLSAEAAYDILQYTRKHLEVLKYYRKCIIPDESYFQTVFMSGPYKNKRMPSLTFVNWGKNRRSPEVLTAADIDTLKEKSDTFVFARKFQMPESGEIIKELSTIGVEKEGKNDT